MKWTYGPLDEIKKVGTGWGTRWVPSCEWRLGASGERALSSGMRGMRGMLHLIVELSALCSIVHVSMSIVLLPHHCSLNNTRRVSIIKQLTIVF